VTLILQSKKEHGQNSVSNPLNDGPMHGAHRKSRHATYSARPFHRSIYALFECVPLPMSSEHYFQPGDDGLLKSSTIRFVEIQILNSRIDVVLNPRPICTGVPGTIGPGRIEKLCFVDRKCRIFRLSRKTQDQARPPRRNIKST
jgi:hypothetical protein